MPLGHCCPHLPGDGCRHPALLGKPSASCRIRPADFAVCETSTSNCTCSLIEMHGKCQQARVEEPSFNIAVVLWSLVSSGQCICLVSGLRTEIVCFCATPSQLSLHTETATKPREQIIPLSAPRAASDTQRFGAEPAQSATQRL